MTTKYKNSKDIPTAILIKRLKELVKACTIGRMNEFDMRVPAERDRDADLVLREVANRLEKM